MTEPVKPKRRYASERRLEQAAGTRAAVIAAARTLFVETGWKATTIAAVARAAGVSSETVYAVFSSKEGLLRAVIEASIRRDRPDTPLLEQAGPQGLAAAGDQREVIALFARDIAAVLGSVADLMAVVRTAAETDAEMGALYRGLHEGRRRNLSFAAAALLKHGPLRGGIGEAEATAVLWRLASPELFLLLTRTEGLGAEAYAGWLAETLEAVLVAPRQA
ncbi:MAG TPA: helix-turn-helix domain-containing protein [Devosia sp.]|nr:helix-turn-helix domain-containing protein [Devosia sp.]